jgi:hypothetical protein
MVMDNATAGVDL